ncbi:MAG: VOC family protein [Candidatus Dormibacteraeota bacterium]|nr:VOC family protein [Candidatus Dormibacteraeota bacterium]
MIAGTHAILFADDADSARTFLRDVLGLTGVDAGGGWLIFTLPPAEVAVHPSVGAGGATPSPRHELYLMCHDLKQTVAELESRGVEFTTPVSDEGFGLLTRFKIPGAGEIGLYQPRHPSPLPEFRSGA